MVAGEEADGKVVVEIVGDKLLWRDLKKARKGAALARRVVLVRHDYRQFDFSRSLDLSQRVPPLEG